jgi:hypothetical protein
MSMETDGDMGPYAGMDPALYKAITRYGTPPHRQIVQVSVEDVGSYQFDSTPDTIDGWLEYLAEIKAKIPAEHFSSHRVQLEYERGYYDEGDSASFKVWYERPETDAEITARVERGIAYVRQNADNELRQYLALKAKFEPGK